LGFQTVSFNLDDLCCEPVDGHCNEPGYAFGFCGWNEREIISMHFKYGFWDDDFNKLMDEVVVMVISLKRHFPLDVVSEIVKQKIALDLCEFNGWNKFDEEQFERFELSESEYYYHSDYSESDSN
jgi:hypothetical protein